MHTGIGYGCSIEKGLLKALIADAYKVARPLGSRWLKEEPRADFNPAHSTDLESHKKIEGRRILVRLSHP
jgi:hypothetical protein